MVKQGFLVDFKYPFPKFLDVKLWQPEFLGLKYNEISTLKAKSESKPLRTGVEKIVE